MKLYFAVSVLLGTVLSAQTFALTPRDLVLATKVAVELFEKNPHGFGENYSQIRARKETVTTNKNIVNVEVCVEQTGEVFVAVPYRCEKQGGNFVCQDLY